MASNYDDSIPIDVYSNGENIAEVDSREAHRPTMVRTGVYKSYNMAGGVGNPPKCQRKLTSIVWKHYEFLPPQRVIYFMKAK